MSGRSANALVAATSQSIAEFSTDKRKLLAPIDVVTAEATEAIESAGAVFASLLPPHPIKWMKIAGNKQ